MNLMILESLQIPIDARVIKPGISVGLIFRSLESEPSNPHNFLQNRRYVDYGNVM